jgi:hypothetical protein
MGTRKKIKGPAGDYGKFHVGSLDNLGYSAD